MEAMAQTDRGKAKLDEYEKKLSRATQRASGADGPQDPSRPQGAKSENEIKRDKSGAKSESETKRDKSTTGGSSGSGIARDWRGQPIESQN